MITYRGTTEKLWANISSLFREGDESLLLDRSLGTLVTGMKHADRIARPGFHFQHTEPIV